MFAVIFEVQPKPGKQQEYLDIAATQRAEVAAIDGFISLERFHGLGPDGALLSLSFWRDGDAVRRWREHTKRHLAEIKDRGDLVAGYRITVAEVERQYGIFDRIPDP